MMKARCNVMISAIRSENSEKCEMISQILYGEACEILEEIDGFHKIRMDFDGTEGFVNSLHLDKNFIEKETYVLQKNFVVLDLPEGRSLLSCGSEIFGKADVIVDENNLGKSITEMAKSFLNVPFLSGGRSFFGTDSEGFIQIIFKIHGINLPRKSLEIANSGALLDFLQEAQPGDLAFFENENGEIIHCGIMLNSQKIIHCFDKVRIDDLDSAGIFNKDAGRRTHKLRFLKRIL